MYNIRSPKKLFNIVKKYHAYFNKRKTTIYMCHAAEYAYKEGKITKDEYFLVKRVAMNLVRSYGSGYDNLVSALKGSGVIGKHTPYKYVEYIIKDTWINYIKSME